MQQFAIIKTGYQSKKQSGIKFYYLADSANCTLGLGLCKVDKFALEDSIVLNLRAQRTTGCDWLNLTSKIDFNLDFTKHLINIVLELIV